MDYPILAQRPHECWILDELLEGQPVHLFLRSPSLGLGEGQPLGFLGSAAASESEKLVPRMFPHLRAGWGCG